MRTDAKFLIVVCLFAATPSWAQDTWGRLVSEATKLTVLEYQLKAQGADVPSATPMLQAPRGTYPAPSAPTASASPGPQILVSPPAAVTAVPQPTSKPTITVQNPTPPPPPPPVSVQSWASQQKATP